MRTPVRRVDPDRPDAAVIAEAARIILAGGLVAFPTETVYGLGADGTNPDAIRRVYMVKGRAFTKPLLVLIADRSWLAGLAEAVPDAAIPLMQRFWPGPLTLTFQAAPTVPPELLGGGTTIGVRLPGPSIAFDLTRTVGRPVTAPSANRSGAPNPTCAADVVIALDGEIDLILDGGQSGDSVPSTVVDVTTAPPTLIRPGRVPFDEIMRVWHGHAD
ncbi:MAG: threonylcarbamoyl-AMP synthase [Candidatus Latescibacteria bacterium]|nr:threonylcarbamoyl-AMP synthase [Candidatus Latescibacterota bacterium]